MRLSGIIDVLKWAPSEFQKSTLQNINVHESFRFLLSWKLIFLNMGTNRKYHLLKYIHLLKYFRKHFPEKVGITENDDITLHLFLVLRWEVHYLRPPDYHPWWGVAVWSTGNSSSLSNAPETWHKRSVRRHEQGLPLISPEGNTFCTLRAV